MISIGVDIGTYSIKVAEVESTSKSYVIRRIQEFPLSLDLTKDKKIEIIDTLRTLFGQINKDKVSFVFAIPQQSVSLRMLNFPFRERFKVQKAVAAQLEDDLPFSQEEAIFDTKIVRFVGKGSEVLAMAVPKDRIGDVLNLSHDCGVEPSLISAESLALGNLFESWMSPPPETVALAQEIPSARSAELILNIGHLNTQMLIYVDGMMLGVRSVDWGARNVADAIATKYGLNYLQGMRELQLKGAVLLDKSTASKEQLTFSQTIEKPIADLVNILKLKMLEAQSELNLQWTKGSFVGGGSQIRNLGALLTQSFEIPFNRFKQFEMHPAVNFETNPQIEAVSAVAVGLALEGLKRPRNPATNFLKGEFAQQSHFFESMWERWGYTAQLAGTAFVFLMIYGMTRESISQHLVEESEKALQVQAEAVAGLKGKKASQGNIRKFLANVEKEAKNRKAAQKVLRINAATDILNRISATLPTTAQVPLEIKRLTVEADTAELHGYTNSASDSQKVLQALQKVSSDGRIEAVNPHIKVPAGKSPFACKFKIQRFSGG